MQVSSVPRDSTIASSLVVQDYVRTHVRKEKGVNKALIPRTTDTAFGNFPASYKRRDHWDGNPTLRRGMRKDYTPALSPMKKPQRSSFPQSPPRQQQQQQQQYQQHVQHQQQQQQQHAQPARIEITGHSKQSVARPKTAMTTREQASTQASRPHQPSAQRPATASSSRTRPTQPSRAAPTQRPRRSGGSRGNQEEEKQLGLEELQRTKEYLKTKGKFQITPSKLMTSLEVARATNTRPSSAPAYLRGKVAPKPPKAGAWRRRPIPSTLFRKYYERGDLPLCIEHRANGNGIKWKINTADLDYHVYLPLFFSGLREVEDPFRFLAIQGTLDMIERAPEKVLPVVPQIILPLKMALNTREPSIISPALKILQQMILLNPVIGQALVPYYRQILPICNLYKSFNKNLGDGIDYNQRSRTVLGELVHETLEIMEQFGGPDAFINIRYMIATYESAFP